MPNHKFQQLLKIASEQVPFGIYAVKKNDYAELRNDKAKSMTNLKNMIHDYKAAGYKVYSNGRL